MYQVIQTEKFDKDFLDISNYISSVLHNNDAVKKLNDNINKAIIEIQKYPQFYPVLRNIFSTIEYHRYKIGKYYIVYYYDDEIVYIVRLIYTGRDISNIKL